MGAQEGENGGDSAVPTDQVKTDNLYENRTGAKKIIRVITVMAYMVSVSFVAMVLSGYYVFLWQPPNPRLLHRAQQRTDPQIEYRVDDEPLAVKIGAPDRLVGQRSLPNRFSNMSAAASSMDEAKNSTSSQSNSRRNETVGDVPRISTATWDPVVRRVIDAAHISSSLERSLNDTADANDLGNAFNGSHHFDGHLARNLTAASSSTRPSGAVSTKTGSPPTTEATTEATFDNDVQARNHSDQHNLLKRISYGGSVANDMIDHRIVIGTTTNGTENYDDSTENYATSGAREIRENRTIDIFDDRRKGRARAQPNKSGSHMTRVPALRDIANNSVAHDKHATNVPAQVASPDFMGDSVTEDMEGTSESSPIESASLIVHPELQSSNDERKETTNERLIQDTDDFDFI